MRLREICILAITLAGLLVIGFRVNIGSFADNLLASAADIIVGIFIAFYLVNRISRRENARKWERVKVLTYKSIESVCDRIMFAFQTEAGVSWESSPYTKEAAEAEPRHPWHENFFRLGEEISRRTCELSRINPIVVDPQIRHPGLPDDISVSQTRDGITVVSDERHARQLRDELLHRVSSQQLLLEVTPHLEKLSLNIFPRILEVGEQENLVSSFIDVEAAFQDWEFNVEMIEESWGMPEKYAWEAVAQFCDRIGKMLKIIYLPESESVARR